jgi:hypothetical protein
MSDFMQSAGVVQQSNNNRRHERLPVDAKVKYKVINRQTAEEVVGPGLRPDGKSVNISVSGLAISTVEALNKGDFIKVEISLPGMPRPSRSLAEVMWARVEDGQNVAGIRFMIFLNEADDSSIRRFIENQGQEGGGQ